MRVSEKDIGKVKKAIQVCKTEYHKVNKNRESSRKKANKIKKIAKHHEGRSH